MGGGVTFWNLIIDTLCEIKEEEVGQESKPDAHKKKKLNRCHFTTKSKFVVQSTLQTPCTNRFARAPRGRRDPLRLAQGGALPYKGARHCPDFSLAGVESKPDARKKNLNTY